jgi:hypothetical protein
MALHTGTYVVDNYTSEVPPLNSIFEANAGIAFNKSGKTWIDVGIMPSHIGFESAIASDNWTLTRSLLAENSPYFEAGAKLSHQVNPKLQAALLALNGWQRINKVNGNSIISTGTQLTYKRSDSLLINWSTFIGTDDPDLTRRMRYFSNLYAQVLLNKNLGVIAGFDIGFQQKWKGSQAYDAWFSPILIARLGLTEQWTAVMRAEYYQDKSAVIMDVNHPQGFSSTGFSFGLDYSPYKDVLCRFEARNFHDENQIYAYNDGSKRRDNVFFITSIAIKFSEIISD